MRPLMLLTALICVFYQFGCSEYSDVQMTDTEQIFITDSQVLYETLWNEYGWHFNDQSDLDALRAITSTQTYLNYLAEVHPTEAPVDSFEAYFRVAPPDPARYTAVLQQWTDTPTAEDIAVAHHETRERRDTSLMGFNLRCIKTSYSHLDCLDDEEFVNNLIESLEANSWDPRTSDFWKRHNISIRAFRHSFDIFGHETLKADAIWLEEQMSRLGRAQGLLWSAIHRPALMSEILYHFSSTALFLVWIEEQPDLSDYMIDVEIRTYEE